jgi:hypothetical protein
VRDALIRYQEEEVKNTMDIMKETTVPISNMQLCGVKNFLFALPLCAFTNNHNIMMPTIMNITPPDKLATGAI